MQSIINRQYSNRTVNYISSAYKCNKFSYATAANCKLFMIKRFTVRASYRLHIMYEYCVLY